MTDQEKIEKLAEWFGRNMFDKDKDGRCLAYEQHSGLDRPWNPLINIADAWMLVEKVNELYQSNIVSPIDYACFEGMSKWLIGRTPP